MIGGMGLNGEIMAYFSSDKVQYCDPTHPWYQNRASRISDGWLNWACRNIWDMVTPECFSWMVKSHEIKSTLQMVNHQKAMIFFEKNNGWTVKTIMFEYETTLKTSRFSRGTTWDSGDWTILLGVQAISLKNRFKAQVWSFLDSFSNFWGIKTIRGTKSMQLSRSSMVFPWKLGGFPFFHRRHSLLPHIWPLYREASEGVLRKER